MREQTLKQNLLAADLGLSEDDFGSWASDLYIRVPVGRGAELLEWLKKNAPRYSKPLPFWGESGSNFSGRACLEIPFGYDEFYLRKERKR